jgi:hypothetical protein
VLEVEEAQLVGMAKGAGEGAIVPTEGHGGRLVREGFIPPYLSRPKVHDNQAPRRKPSPPEDQDTAAE